MTAVLLWKECRQQRAIWLAIAILAVVLVVSLSVTLGQGSGWQVFQDGRIGNTLNLVVLCLAVAQGVVAGALLLAGEHEEGTLVFLDCLTGQRGPVWARKCLAGVLITLAQSVLLIGLAVGLGFVDWGTAASLPILGLNGLAWGLLGGALCRTVLAAVLTAIVLMAFSWLVPAISRSFLALALAVPAAGLGAAYASWLVFCWDDRSRQPVPEQRKRTSVPGVPSDWLVLSWLAMRQGRWVLAGCLAGSLVLGLTVNGAALMVWPIGTLLMGLACGLTVFAPDQDDGARFLASQRFPPGRVWTVKTLFWGMAVVGLTALAFVKSMTCFVMWAFGAYRHPEGSATWHSHWLGFRDDSWAANLNPLSFLVLFLGLWPVYGFCFGQFFGQVARRPIIAYILAVFLTPLVVALWVPSLVLGGVPAWQVLIVPVLLLLTTRLVQRPWLAGRLWTARPLVGIASAAALMVACLAGSLWHRAVEIPDVGEPFDVKAFIASLPTPENNKAGKLIRSAVAGMQKHRQEVEKELEPVERDERKLVPAEWGSPKKGRSESTLRDVLQKGWPKEDKEISQWLDRHFEGAWVREAEEAAPLPMGMVQDIRLTDINTYRGIGQDCQHLAELFTARALQLQARGDSRAALKHLETTLALSRHVRNFAPLWLFECGDTMERSALAGFHHWLQKTGPDKDLLRTGLAILRQHETALPDAANTIKAQYLIFRNSPILPRQVESGLYALQKKACLMPWEKERQIRIVHAIYLGELSEIRQPVGTRLQRIALQSGALGLPPVDGPGSNLSARQWGEFIHQCQIHHYAPFSLGYLVDAGQRARHAVQLVTAVAIYQADHGKPPPRLDDLVPAYLAALPIDVSTGALQFDYRISQGEVINNNPALTLAPGQALVWCKREEPRNYYPVPLWEK